MVRYKKHGLALGILLYQQLHSVIQMTALKKILNVIETSCFYCCVCILHFHYHYTIIWNNNNENFNPQILPILWLPLSTDNRINLSLIFFPPNSCLSGFSVGFLSLWIDTLHFQKMLAILFDHWIWVFTVLIKEGAGIGSRPSDNPEMDK